MDHGKIAKRLLHELDVEYESEGEKQQLLQFILDALDQAVQAVPLCSVPSHVRETNRLPTEVDKMRDNLI